MHCMKYVNWSVFVAVARPTLSVDRLLGYNSFTALSVSRSRNCNEYTTAGRSLTSAVYWPPCPKILRSSHAHSPGQQVKGIRSVFCFLQRKLPESRLAWLPARRVAKWHNPERRIRTACTCSAGGMVVYRV